MRHNCLFCMRPISEGVRSCDSPECQEWVRELDEDLERCHRDELSRAWRAALVQRCKDDQDWQLNRFQRWFYTAKCLICFAFGWTYHGQESYPDQIEVAMHDYSESYGGWSSRSIFVGRGLFSQWWFDLDNDGDSSL